MDDHSDAIEKAARLLSSAGGLLITAGAGIGVDSGLPDFRGADGFWNAYPALAKAKLNFAEIASPHAFRTDPELAWGFYGHRLRLYRDTRPHEGFHILLELAARLPQGAFVFTSNVDGQFQKAGFPEHGVSECHGSIHYLQCLKPCQPLIWPADDLRPEVDEATCRWSSSLPQCPHCGSLARPNILMFGDWDWIEQRSYAQQKRLEVWRQNVEHLVVVELGAGVDIPSARRFGEETAAPLIRINPLTASVKRSQDIAIPMGALDGLRRIDAILRER